MNKQVETLEKVIAWDEANQNFLRVLISFDSYNVLSVNYYIYRMEQCSEEDIYEATLETLEEIGMISQEASYDQEKERFVWMKNMSMAEMEDFLFGSSSALKAYYCPPYYPRLENAGASLDPANYIDNLSPEVEVLISLCKRHQGKELSDSLAGFIKYWFDEVEEISPEDVVAAL
ncbi:hypothetical protein ACKQTC_07255 [Peptococcus simiae]|uniref:DUF4375 domain-containing protein n=1 Tax=Peptococcus simiae TaxID=1643805 RepID=A0ABW9GZX3_9FIRM